MKLVSAALLSLLAATVNSFQAPLAPRVSVETALRAGSYLESLNRRDTYSTTRGLDSDVYYRQPSYGSREAPYSYNNGSYSYSSSRNIGDLSNDRGPLNHRSAYGPYRTGVHRDSYPPSPGSTWPYIFSRDRLHENLSDNRPVDWYVNDNARSHRWSRDSPYSYRQGGYQSTRYAPLDPRPYSSSRNGYYNSYTGNSRYGSDYSRSYYDRNYNDRYTGYDRYGYGGNNYQSTRYTPLNSRTFSSPRYMDYSRDYSIRNDYGYNNRRGSGRDEMETLRALDEIRRMKEETLTELELTELRRQRNELLNSSYRNNYSGSYNNNYNYSGRRY